MTDTKFLNSDLSRDLEKIKDYHRPKLSKDEMENDGEDMYTIEVLDNTYFYVNESDRDEDFRKLWEEIH
jgi:hypothetical protein